MEIITKIKQFKKIQKIKEYKETEIFFCYRGI